MSSKRRIRTHINPLSYPTPIERSQWTSVLDESKPLHVDLGCGEGDYIIASAKKHPEKNFVGVEIREPLAELVNQKIKKENLKNVICLRGNASVSIKSLFKENEVEEFTIHFPDPWIKPKHIKRRMVKDYVVRDMYQVLSEKGKVFLLTDIEDIFDDFSTLLKEKFEQVPYKNKAIKTYWEKIRNETETPLFSACFVK